MLNKKILGMPLYVALIAVLVIGMGTAALLDYYVTISGDANVDQSVVFDDDETTATYSFNEGAFYAGQSFTEEAILKNRAEVPATIKIVPSCSATKESNDCDGITWEYISRPKANDDGSGGFGDPETIAFNMKTNGETLNEIFSGEGFSYTYEVLNGGSSDGTAPLVAVFELDNGNHVVLFPGSSARTEEHSLTFNELTATATANSGDVVVDFVVYDSDFVVNEWTSNNQYADWAYLKANGSSLSGDLPLEGTEKVIDAYFMTQGAGTGQEDAILNFVYNGEQTTFKKVTDWKDITLQPGEEFYFQSKFNFNVSLVPDTYELETKVIPV